MPSSRVCCAVRQETSLSASAGPTKGTCPPSTAWRVPVPARAVDRWMQAKTRIKRGPRQRRRAQPAAAARQALMPRLERLYRAHIYESVDR